MINSYLSNFEEYLYYLNKSLNYKSQAIKRKVSSVLTRMSLEQIIKLILFREV